MQVQLNRGTNKTNSVSIQPFNVTENNFINILNERKRCVPIGFHKSLRRPLFLFQETIKFCTVMVGRTVCRKKVTSATRY